MRIIDSHQSFKSIYYFFDNKKFLACWKLPKWEDDINNVDGIV